MRDGPDYKVGYKKPPKGKPFQKGHVTNPNGRPALTPDLLEARKVTKLTFEGKLQEYLRMPMAQLRAIVEAPDTPNLDLLVGSIITRAIMDGCITRMNFLLDRMGVAKTSPETDNTINVTPDGQNNPNMPFYVVEINENGRFLRSRPRELSDEEKQAPQEAGE